MRIIGGKYRGQKLFSPDNGAVRPTSDRAREALFNILRSRLGNDLEKYSLVDVFSGSGAFALEALSQGFGKVALIDVDTRPLLKNVALFPDEKKKINIFKRDALKLEAAETPFDVLFMDAPYRKNLTVPALENLCSKGWLKPKALCLIEVEKDEECLLPSMFEKIEERRYGLAKILIAEVAG